MKTACADANAIAEQTRKLTRPGLSAVRNVNNRGASLTKGAHDAAHCTAGP